IPGADIRIANSLIFKDNICTGRAVIKVPIDGKYSVLKGLLSDLGYPFDSVVTIGDSKGDIEIMHASRLSIAVDPVDTSVIKAADYVLARHQLLRIPELIKRNRQKITTKK
ncbi:HAD hydrolase family protein, partial [bacterium]|nr:HAD hydrolase family protein [candidate division CSSED10-310 bacterium]